jgi:hypothetical protein
MFCVLLAAANAAQPGTYAIQSTHRIGLFVTGGLCATLQLAVDVELADA